MNEKKGTFQKLARKLAYKMIEKETEGWPPHCPGNIYQPMRPCEKASAPAEVEQPTPYNLSQH